MSKDLLDFSSMDSIFNSIFRFDDWFSNWNGYRPHHSPSTINRTHQLPVDIMLKENRDAVIEVAVAGYKEDNISIDFEGDNLIIRAKKDENEKEDTDRYICHNIKRSNAVVKVYIPASRYNYNGTEASLKDGILSIRIPVKDDAKVKKIEIIKQ